MINELTKRWESATLEELIIYVLGGDWGQEYAPEVADEFAIVKVIRGTEFKYWYRERGKSGVLRIVKLSSLKKRRLQEGDIVIEISGGGPTQPVGRTLVIDKVALQISQYPLICSNFFRQIRLHCLLNSDYINFYLNHNNQLGKYNEFQSQTTNLRNLNFNDFISNVLIPLPPLNEQRRIVEKLEKLLAKVDTCKQRLDKIPNILKRFRQSVLAAACSGRLTADWRENNPDVEPASELLKRIQEKRLKQHKEEYDTTKVEGKRKPKQPHFGKVEEYNNIFTWNLTTLESVTEVIVDCPHSTPKWTDSGRICVRTTNFEPFNLNLKDIKYVSEETYQERILRLEPKAGDVLYSREGGILGIACQIPPGVNLCLGQRMMLIRCYQEGLSGQYMTMLLNSEVILSQVKELITGTASPHLNVGDVRNFKIPIPPLVEQQEIVNRVQTLFKLADQIEQRYQKAKNHVDQLTQSILAKAFRGELVPQDPNDEPASVLLERIRAERTKRETETKTAKKSTGQKGKRRSKKDEVASVPLDPTPIPQKQGETKTQKFTKQEEQQELEPIQLELPLY